MQFLFYVTNLEYFISNRGWLAQMTEDTSPENLRKFLESDDPVMVRMGLSMAKNIDIPEELYTQIFSLSLWTLE